MKEPLEIGTFLHRPRGDCRWNYVLLVCGRVKIKNGWRYSVAQFYYYPNTVSCRLDRFGAAWFTNTSSVLKKEGWRPVDVSEGEVAE